MKVYKTKFKQKKLKKQIVDQNDLDSHQPLGLMFGGDDTVETKDTNEDAYA